MKTKYMDVACYSILLVAVAIVGIQLTSTGSVSGQEDESPIISAAQDGQNGNDGVSRLPLSAEVAGSAGGGNGADGIGAGNGADGVGNGADGIGVRNGADNGVGNGADGVGNGGNNNGNGGNGVGNGVDVGNGADGVRNGADGKAGADGVDGINIGNGADGKDGADTFGLQLEASIP